MKKETLVDAICMMTLVGFALVQPLYDLLSRNAAFFVLHQSQPIDILLLVGLLSVLLPLGLTAAMFLLPGRRWTRAAMLIVLTTLILAPLLGRIRAMPTLMGVSLALAGGIGVAWARERFATFRLFLLTLSPALVVFPVLFLTSAQISPLLGKQPEPTVHQVSPKRQAPVILIVFDEFPLASLLNEKHEIDAGRFPNFAKLSQRSHWFRNATTVHPWTVHVLPAMLSGNRSQSGQQPRWEELPNNLFTLLGKSHEARAIQSGFSATLCPPSLNSWKKKPGFGDRMELLLKDLLVVESHLLLPKEWTHDLPAIDTNWSNFWQSESSFTDRRELFHEFLTSLKSGEGRPGLHFLHSMVPHVPSSYLPSGKGYGRDTCLVGLGANKTWTSDASLVDHAHQRHLLQVGYVDKLLGELIAHLHTIGIYDECLLVITADHGCSFRAGMPYRGITDKTFADILRVPLFIKLPNQQDGHTSDRNVQHVDILPTITDVLGVKIPWPIEGQSAFDEARPRPSEKLVLVDGEPQRFDANLNGDWGNLENQIAKFGLGNWPRLFKNGPEPILIGRKVVTQKRVNPSGQLQCQLDSPSIFQHLSAGTSFVPSRIQGTLISKEDNPRSVSLAIAVNGTIQATTSVPVEPGKPIIWAVMAPEEAFEPGDNQIEVFEIHRGDKALSLLCSTESGQQTTYRMEGDSLIDSSGQRYPIRRKACEGYLDIFHVDRSCVTFSGWAADLKRKQLPTKIVMLADGEHFHAGPLTANREDVVAALKEKRFKWSGFNFCFPRERFRGAESRQFRFFALTPEGEASELHYREWYVARSFRPFHK